MCLISSIGTLFFTGGRYSALQRTSSIAMSPVNFDRSPMLICQKYLKRDCPELPCELVHSSAKSLQDLKCLHGGRVWREKDDGEQRAMHSCHRGFALDLFSRKDNRVSYPSINTHALTSFSDQLYSNVLHLQFRTRDSMWGLNFNFESISHYPWAADREKLALFDLTFGYDRQIYDFVPQPWLFDYVERLKFNTSRLTLEKAMEEKRLVRSPRDGNSYWPTARWASRFSSLIETMLCHSFRTAIVRKRMSQLRSSG